MGDFRGAIERDADKLIMALLIGAAIVGLVSGFQENGLWGGILGAGVGAVVGFIALLTIGVGVSNVWTVERLVKWGIPILVIAAIILLLTGGRF
jgi:hypothetical protein